MSYQHHHHHEHIIGGRKEDWDILLKEEPIKTAKDWLMRTKVNELFPENRTALITVRRETPIMEALNILAINRILSVPVYDEEKRLFVQFVDMLDILTYLLKHEELKTKSWDSVSKKFMNAKVKDCAEMSGRGLFYPVDENAPLLVIIDLMILKKVHRVPIVDGEGNLKTIITQSHIAQLVAKNHLELFHLQPKVSDLKLGLKEVISIESDQLTVDAFRTIYDKKVLGVAVVEHGKLIGNISASDIKSVLNEDMSGWENLYIPCRNFVRDVLKMTKLHIVCTFSSLDEVFCKFGSSKAHRLYVVDDDFKPIGIISLVDALEALRRMVI